MEANLPKSHHYVGRPPVPPSPWVRLSERLALLWHFMQREHLTRLLLLTSLILIASALAISVVEPGMTVLNGLWWSIVTMTTVGYGDISPATLGGRVIAVFMMLTGIGLLGMFSASVASALVESKLREERGLSTYKVRDHIIVCEWNHRTREIIHELRSDPKTARQPLVLIADIPNKPINDDNLYLVAGNVNDETLQRANLAEAHTMLILGDERLEPTARDAKVVLATLTVESMNRDAYTIVELVSSENVRHCQRACANEIIVNNNVTSGLLARATLDHGITKVISEWLSTDGGDELYKISTPRDLVNQPFLQAMINMKQQHGCIILGVERHVDGSVLSNPPADYLLCADDELIVVSAERPQV